MRVVPNEETLEYCVQDCMEWNEDELIDGCLKGRRQAQNALYEAYSRRMYALCLRYCKSPDQAADVLQEGFIKVFQNLERFKRECPLEYWIRRIIVNTALKHLRKEKKLWMRLVDREPADDREIAGATHNDGLAGLQWQDLVELVQALPEGYRAVFNLHAVEGFSHKEIGEMLDISDNTSKSQYARARAALRERLARQKKAVEAV